MIDFLKDKNKFTILFFSLLIADILVKLCCPVFPYRYISKPPILILLILFYYLNQSETGKNGFKWTMIGLSFFLTADVVLINLECKISLGIALFLVSLAKLFFCFRLSHRFDFKVRRLIPFSIIMFSYTVGLISLVYDGLKGFFVPALISFFISLLLFQFAFLRKGVVNNKSYRLVFFGVVLFMISEGLMAIKTFRTDLPFQDGLIMFCYGASMYSIVIGIVNERVIKKVNLF
ncbi:lysoplasmalogenase family protein [uncultured Algibacter sp.]|uniref:lysoplasmalogenase family protein n=1 Tax=uncultured Algibacter sp. TaxID=298659 RepID=UPI00260AA429|nr:lysoplasmalogenase family protein [uncultured Algibacter sp.]